jgi:hypothetical protein
MIAVFRPWPIQEFFGTGVDGKRESGREIRDVSSEAKLWTAGPLLRFRWALFPADVHNCSDLPSDASGGTGGLLP